MTDVATIKTALRGRWPDALTTLAGLDAAILDGRHYPCPKCGGTDRFRAFGDFAETGGVTCNQCHSTENGDGVSTLQWMQDVTFPQACRMLADFAGINGNGRPCGSADIVADVARRKRVPLESWRAFGAAKAMRGKLQVCRLPMYGADGQPCSEFDLATADEKWLKGLAASGKPAGLFLAGGKLPSPGETVLLTEGPKDAAALHSLGFQVVGLPTKELSVKFAGLFAGCNVIIVPDRDADGEAGANKTAARLAGIAASARIAHLPGELKPKSGDGAREILARQHGETLLREAIDRAAVWEPTRPAEGPSVLDEQGRTDVANAERFVGLHGREVRFCHPWKKWLVWDGRRWKVDDDGTVLRLAKSVSDDIWREARGTGSDAALKFAVASAKAQSVAAILKLAACDVAVLPDDLDADGWQLNCANGTVDLRSGELRPHDRDDRLTMICPTAFDLDAKAPTWERFLNDVFDGDGELIAFVQRYLGYSLTGDVREQVLPIFWGEGANGKSTLLNAFLHVVGKDFAMQAPSDLLLLKKGESHPTERADLFRKRFVSAVETEAGRKLAESLVKALTGGDRIRARRMREDFWEFAPTHKLILCTNHKPKVRGTDHAIWRRLKLVPFVRRFDGDNADKTMPAKLGAEADGILAWAVRGCLEWQEHGLGEPEQVTTATATYKEQSDPLHEFIRQCCVLGDELWTATGDLRKAYDGFCSEVGQSPVGGERFTESLQKHGCVNKRRNQGRGWFGIGILTERDPETGDF